MEIAILNGIKYSALEVSKNYELEKRIKRDSGKTLRCQEPECKAPVIKYCHGEKEVPFFSHIKKCDCDYSTYTKKLPSVVRMVKSELYNSFKKRGYNVEIDAKVISGHYTHLLFNFKEGKVALEIATKDTSVCKLEELCKKYSESNIMLSWIVIGDPKQAVNEENSFFVKRYMLNETGVNDLIVISEDATILSQYRIEPNKYEYRGEIFKSRNYPSQVFMYSSYIDELKIDARGNLGFKEFEDEFDSMAQEKRREYEDWKSQFLENLEKNGRVKIIRKPNAEEITIMDSYLDKKAFSELYGEFFDREKTCINNRYGNRMYRCLKCGYIGDRSMFRLVGYKEEGKIYFSKGECYSCKQ